MAPQFRHSSGLSFIDRYFLITARGSTISTEIRAGIVTFLTMSYILLVNPQILGNAGLPVQKVVSSTALTSCLASLLVGLFANIPVGVTPGMGLNAYLVYSQVLGLGTSVEVALACCMTAAILVGVLALIRALTLILHLVPNAIKLAVVVGMGLLLSFIGLQTAHVVVKSDETIVGLGNLWSAEVVLAALGLTMIATLHYRNIKGSILIGVLGTALGYFAIKDSWPTEFISLPAFGVWELDFGPVLAWDPDAWSAVVAYALVMIFDIGGALYGLCSLAGLVKEGQLPGAVATYLSASLATGLGALTGTTPLIIAAESAVGIKEGGRTGLVAITVAACFGVSLFFAPILQAVPAVATAPVLVLVGAMMMGEAGHIDWTNMPSAVPAFLTMVIQPFTFSIANGIYAGILFSLLLFITTGEFITYFRSLISSAESDEAQETLGLITCQTSYPGSYTANVISDGSAVGLNQPLLAHQHHSPIQQHQRHGILHSQPHDSLQQEQHQHHVHFGGGEAAMEAGGAGSGDLPGSSSALASPQGRTSSSGFERKSGISIVRSVSRRIMHDIAASPAYTSSTHALLISGGQHHRPGGTASSYGTSPGGSHVLATSLGSQYLYGGRSTQGDDSLRGGSHFLPSGAAGLSTTQSGSQLPSIPSASIMPPSS